MEEEETQLTLLTEIRDILAENGSASGKHGAEAALGADKARSNGSPAETAPAGPGPFAQGDQFMFHGSP